jgi:hypothetical protein
MPVWCSTGNQRFGVLTRKRFPTRIISERKAAWLVRLPNVFDNRIGENDIEGFIVLRQRLAGFHLLIFQAGIVAHQMGAVLGTYAGDLAGVRIFLEHFAMPVNVTGPNGGSAQN